MWIVLRSFFTPKNIGVLLIIGLILGSCLYISSEINTLTKNNLELEKNLTKEENKNKNLNDQLQKQNEEIKAKDKFIINNQKIIVRKNIYRAVPDDNIIKWLRDHRCEACR